MNKNIMYEELYGNMVKGVYNDVVISFENNLEPTSEILVSKVKNACDDRDVDFDDFLNYARELTSEILVSKVRKACDDGDVDFDDFLNYARDRKKGEESE